MDKQDTQNETLTGRRRRTPRVIAAGLGLLGLGAAAGGVTSTALSAGAATTPTSSVPAQSSSGSTSSGGSSSTAPAAPGNSSSTAPAAPPALPLSGTVTAVGSASVTIQTSTGTTTYAVTSSSDIDKNGEATLSDLAVGDAVTFSTVTTNGTTAIDKLHAGNAQEDMPKGGPPGGALSLSGTVTAVGSSSVSIQTSTGTTTYAVTSSSDIDKNGEATLSDLAVGDAVTFSTVTTNGTTAIDKLHAGNAQEDMPHGGGPPGPAPGTGSSSSSSSSSTSSA